MPSVGRSAGFDALRPKNVAKEPPPMLDGSTPSVKPISEFPDEISSPISLVASVRKISAIPGCGSTEKNPKEV
jgi:hypothetical protein